MGEFNSDVVTTTLQKVVTILEKNKIRYCFLGSVAVAAINGKLHRNLGDLDLIIDASKKEVLYKELENLGYYPTSGMFMFARKHLSLETLDHTTLLGVGYFYGKWKENGAFMMGDKNINLTVEPHAIKPIKKTLYGIDFFTIPDRAVATGVNESRTNPKRQRELVLLKEKHIEPFPNDYLQITAYGIRLDWVYHFTMGVLNVLGNIRVKMGQPFDPWR